MTKLKLLLTVFILTLLSLVACSLTSKTIPHNKQTSDTVYRFTTQQLKSDQIPDSVFQMMDLRNLSITGQDCDVMMVDTNGNKITNCWMIIKIPSQIKNLQKLATLDLTLNSITEIPNEVVELKNLKLLSLTDNFGLKDITPLTKIKSLEYLYLYGCGLTTIPESISDMKNLKELGLAGNNINQQEQIRIRQSLPNCNVVF